MEKNIEIALIDLLNGVETMNEVQAMAYMLWDSMANGSSEPCGIHTSGAGLLENLISEKVDELSFLAKQMREALRESDKEEAA